MSEAGRIERNERRMDALPKCGVCGNPFVPLSGGAEGCPVHGIVRAGALATGGHKLQGERSSGPSGVLAYTITVERTVYARVKRTDVYESEQLVWYDPKRPTTYYGWLISWPGESSACYPFTNSARRNQWTDRIHELAQRPDKWESEMLAAILSHAAWGDGEFDREAAHEYAHEHYAADYTEEQWDAIIEAYVDFDPSEKGFREPPDPPEGDPTPEERRELELRRAAEAGRP